VALAAATSAAGRGSLGGRPMSILISAATALVILGVAIVPLLTPAWIHGEQDRAGSARALGTDLALANRYSDEVVHDLLFGGSFAIAVNEPCPPPQGCGSLLDAKEVEHMVQVRAVFQALGVIVLASLALLLLTARRATETAERATWWRAVARGGLGLAGFMVVVGVFAVVAFDAMFEVFHELLFPAGSFTFDPATEHLVQIYPDQFWSDTTLALGVLTIAISAGVVLVARHRARRLQRGVMAASAAASGGLAHRSAS
jgi:hypothetical protein